ncbi:HNH endonuclease [Kitasatospora xanthocidica]|uniref:HNH endonuclease n=1 Tax=Kitasatospora xanthocidica TaxID=83382 RepID=UPI0036EA9CD8
MGEAADRAWARVRDRVVEVPHGCIYWVHGALTSDGYAKMGITVGKVHRTVRVHRWLVEQVYGPDPLPGHLVAAHLCNESACLNVRDHLRPISQSSNMRQMAAQGRSAGRAHVGWADTRGQLGRAMAIQAALRDGLDLDRLAAAMREGDPRPLVRAALADGYDAAAYLAAVEASQGIPGQLSLPLADGPARTREAEQIPPEQLSLF